MKKFLRFFIYAFAGLCVLYSTGCDKAFDEEISSQGKEEINSSHEKYIVYQNNNDFRDKLIEITNMTQEERENYELSKGYMSFGRYCDEFYNNINFESFKSQEDIIAFINKNKEYIEIIDEGNGEFTIDVAYNDKSFRYMCGIDKILIINDTAYKILKTKIITCRINNIEELKNITEDNYLNYTNKEDFLFYDSKSILFATKDNSTNNGKSLEATTTNDDNRTKTMAIIELGPPILNYKATCYAGVKVRPYKKTLGIWYYCKRHIDLNTSFYVHYKIDDTWYSTTGYATNSTVYDYVNEFAITVPYYVDDAHFGDIYVYGDTPSTSPAIINY